MNEHRRELLSYIDKNYKYVIVQAIGGPYIVIDLIPEREKEDYYPKNILDAYNSMTRRGLKIETFTDHGYIKKSEDGSRVNRYFYFMQRTTQEILRDLKTYRASKRIKAL